MRTRLSVVWSKAVTVRLRPRACARRVRGVVVVTGVLLVGAAALGVLPMQSDVRLAAEGESASPFTVELTAIDGAPPFDPGDGPGLDTGPSNGIVREGDPVTYVVDIGVRGNPLSDVVVQLPVPRGFVLPSVPDYCGDGSGVDEFGLHCLIGNLEADRYFTRTATMTAGKREDADGLSIAALVTADRSGASWVAGGMLAPLSEGWPGEETALTVGAASLERWPTFGEELGKFGPSVFTADSSLTVALDAADAQDLQTIAEWVTAQGHELEVLGRARIRELEPMLGRGIRSGLMAVGE